MFILTFFLSLILFLGTNAFPAGPVAFTSGLLSDQFKRIINGQSQPAVGQAPAGFKIKFVVNGTIMMEELGVDTVPSPVQPVPEPEPPINRRTSATILGACETAAVRAACTRLTPPQFHVPTFYFDLDKRVCVMVEKGGCGVATNHFYSFEDCDRKCKDYAPNKNSPLNERVPAENCHKEKPRGVCSTVKIRQFYFNEVEGRCKPFWWAQCHEGNFNRFQTLTSCNRICKGGTLSPATKCAVQATKGPCTSWRQRFYYDTEREICRPFFWGGCDTDSETGVTMNRFDTMKECDDTCSSLKRYSDTWPGLSRPTEFALCERTRDEGRENCVHGNSSVVSYYYNTKMRSCDEYRPYKCPGSSPNRFPIKEMCEFNCIKKPAPSGLPAKCFSEVATIPTNPTAGQGGMYVYHMGEQKCVEVTFAYQWYLPHTLFASEGECRETCIEGQQDETTASGDGPGRPIEDDDE